VIVYTPFAQFLVLTARLTNPGMGVVELVAGPRVSEVALTFSGSGSTMKVTDCPLSQEGAGLVSVAVAMKLELIATWSAPV
jgi:hypothetical protein